MNAPSVYQPLDAVHDDIDDSHPGHCWQHLSVAIRRAARRIPRPLPTALVLLEQAGINIDGEV